VGRFCGDRGYERACFLPQYPVPEDEETFFFPFLKQKRNGIREAVLGQFHERVEVVRYPAGAVLFPDGEILS
jgi:hypothetical protein